MMVRLVLVVIAMAKNRTMAQERNRARRMVTATMVAMVAVIMAVTVTMVAMMVVLMMVTMVAMMAMMVAMMVAMMTTMMAVTPQVLVIVLSVNGATGARAPNHAAAAPTLAFALC